MMFIRKDKILFNEQKHYLNELEKLAPARKPIPAVRSNYYITLTVEQARVLQRKR